MIFQLRRFEEGLGGGLELLGPVLIGLLHLLAEISDQLRDGTRFDSGIELVEQRGVAGYREGHGTTSRFTVSWARPRMLVEAVVLTVVFVGFLVYASRATDLGLFFGWMLLKSSVKSV